MTEIPDIRIESIPTIKIIDIPPSQALGFPTPSILLPGCYKQHRDARATNTQIIEDDPGGAYWVCSNGPLPTIKVPEYNRSKIVYSSDKEEEKSESKPKEFKGEQPKIPKQEKKDDVFVPCPGPKDQRIGDFRNEKRLERVKAHKRSDDGSECITLYEPVTFVEQYLPSGATASFTATTALVAATVPLLVPVIKAAVKNIVKKLTSKKKK
tara:strand:- start:107 stop:736 length:630 start_codon:yes stop_codon:yes gene_type:complete